MDTDGKIAVVIALFTLIFTISWFCLGFIGPRLHHQEAWCTLHGYDTIDSPGRSAEYYCMERSSRYLIKPE